MTNAEIVALARLTMSIEQAPNDAALTRQIDAEWDAVSDQFDLSLVMCAMKLLDGRAYSISSDDADHMQRYRSLAKHLGATVIKNRVNPLFASAGIESPHNIVLQPPR